MQNPKDSNCVFYYHKKEKLSLNFFVCVFADPHWPPGSSYQLQKNSLTLKHTGAVTQQGEKKRLSHKDTL